MPDSDWDVLSASGVVALVLVAVSAVVGHVLKEVRRNTDDEPT